LIGNGQGKDLFGIYRRQHMINEKHTLSEEELQAHLDAIYASTSWKVTAPLRRFGKLAIGARQWLRKAAASPRDAARRCWLTTVRHAVKMLKAYPLSARLLDHVRDRFPAMSKRMATTFPVPPPLAAQSAPLLPVVTFDPAYAWSPAMSRAGHFKQMLSNELKQREHKKKASINNATGI
jgi:hypothetical protein